MPLMSNFFHSSKRRSGGRFSMEILLHRLRVWGEIFKLKRAMNCMALRTRRGSSEKAGPMWRSKRFSMSAMPPVGSNSSLVRGSKPIALMVKSRLCTEREKGRSGSISTENPLCPDPVFISVRGRDNSAGRLRNLSTPNAFPTSWQV